MLKLNGCNNYPNLTLLPLERLMYGGMRNNILFVISQRPLQLPLLPHCPRCSCTSTVSMIYLKEVSVLQPNENLPEAALRKWMSPSPTQCGQQFQHRPPPGADCVFSPPGLCDTTNQSFKIQLCNGVRAYHKRSFDRGMPFALPISLQRFSAQGTVVSQLPINITVEATTYELVGCTMSSLLQNMIIKFTS